VAGQQYGKYGDFLKRGQFVITGALVPFNNLKAGDALTAIFEHLGTVSTVFTD